MEKGNYILPLSYEGSAFELEYDKASSTLITHNMPFQWKSDTDFLSYASDVHEQVRSFYTELSLLIDFIGDDSPYIEKEILPQLKDRKKVCASYLAKVKELQRDFIELNLNSSKKAIKTINDRMRKLGKHDIL